MVLPARKAAMRMGLTDCIARSASPTGLLPFRYADGTFLSGLLQAMHGGCRGCEGRPEGIRPTSTTCDVTTGCIWVNGESDPVDCQRSPVAGAPQQDPVHVRDAHRVPALRQRCDPRRKPRRLVSTLQL